MKTLVRSLLVLLALCAVASVVFYLRPVQVQLQIVHARFFLHRVHSEYVATPEGRIHYYEAEPNVTGGGTPIVLVHGLGDRAEAWSSMIFALKKAGFHVYALDLLGYGRSPNPAGSDLSISTQEQLVYDYIQAMGLQKPDVAGWSMGGWITLKLALDHPEVMDRLVVYDAAGVQFQRDYPDTVFHITNVAELRRLAHLLEPEARPLPGFVLRDAVRKFEGQQNVVDRGIAAMLTAKDALDDRLPQMQVPLLLVWGSNDLLLPLQSVGEKMHTLDPRSNLDVVEGCGHLIPQVCTARGAKAAIDFLRAQPAPQGEFHTLPAPPKQ